MKLNRFFPTIIGTATNEDHSNIEKKLVDKCYSLQKKIKSGGENWISKNTYNTSYTYNIWNDEDFRDLNNWVLEQIKEYSKQLNYSSEFTCDSAWFNIYKKYDFQDKHEHSPSSLSCIYYLKTDPEKSAKTWFYSKNTDGLEPLTKIKTIDTSSTISCNPSAGELIIFRSNIEHSVERQETDEDRISLAYNFKLLQQK